MLFGIEVPSKKLGRYVEASLNVNHYEAFSLLVIYTHGRGPEPSKRLSKVEFNDHLASYGVDPEHPGFKTAFRRLRLKKTISRGHYPNFELTYDGCMCSYALEFNADSFDVKHPIPVIEALAGTLRYQDEHEVFANSTVRGGLLIQELHETISDKFPDYVNKTAEKGTAQEERDSTVEELLGTGEFFMYDRRIYMISPGFYSSHDEELD